MGDWEWSIGAGAKDALFSIVSTRSLLSSSKTLLSFWVLLWPFRLFLAMLGGAWFKALRGEGGFSIFTTRGPFAVWLTVEIASSISLLSSIPDSEEDAEECGEGEDNGEGDGGQLSEISESHCGLPELYRLRLGNSSGGQSGIIGSRSVTIWNSGSGSIGMTKSEAQEHVWTNKQTNKQTIGLNTFIQSLDSHLQFQCKEIYCQPKSYSHKPEFIYNRTVSPKLLPTDFTSLPCKRRTIYSPSCKFH